MTDMYQCDLHAIHYLILILSLFTDTNNIAYKNDEIKEIVGVDNQINSDANADSQNAIDTTSSSVHEGEVNPIEVNKLDDTANKDIIPDETEVNGKKHL
jgi:hypothetical protein